eukprot:TRINITY_DN23123_c0_g1_i1.p1 TRINITY_DN23123_c0_g1~~TRINITY_DN23123_c0_g1_i1.p1  ORF type:complete len:511 (+),score=128.31 TRINITY_DN23123_c0_g1_i1:126-1658(+)
MPSKADLQAAERQQTAAEDRLQDLTGKVKQLEQQCIAKRTDKGRLQGELDAARGRCEGAKKQRNSTQLELAALQEEMSKARQAIADRKTQLEAAGNLRDAAEAARGALQRTEDALKKVCLEIQGLQGPEARQAAETAQGGDLVAEQVPGPTPQIPESLETSGVLRETELWAMTNQGCLGSASLTASAATALSSGSGDHGAGGSAASASAADVPTELRVAVQSQAVLAALQRSLCIRATELREGLREWGFARAATGRTKDINHDMEKSTSQNQREKEAFNTERESLQADLLKENTLLQELRAVYEQAQKRCEEVRSKLASEQGVVTKMQGETSQRKTALDEASKKQDQERFELEEAESSIQTKQSQGEKHPAEAVWRLAAAEKLALQAEDQLRKTQIQFDQSKQELAQFQLAYGVLQDAHSKLVQELAVHEQAHQELKEDHSNLNIDLNALARHYMNLLPDLPGMQMPKSTAPVRVGNGVGSNAADPAIPSDPKSLDLGIADVQKMLSSLP